MYPFTIKMREKCFVTKQNNIPGGKPQLCTNWSKLANSETGSEHMWVGGVHYPLLRLHITGAVTVRQVWVKPWLTGWNMKSWVSDAQGDKH